MLKVTVYGHDCVLDDVVEGLQRAGVLQVEQADFEEQGLSVPSPDYPRLNAVDERIANSQFLTDFLARFREPDVAFGAFISEKIHLGEDEYRSLAFDGDLPGLYRECVHISDRLGHIEREVARLEELVVQLRPWRSLRLQISEWRGTRHVALFTGTVPLASAPEMRQALRDACDEVSVEEAGDDGRQQAWVVMTHKDHLADVRAALDPAFFTEVRFDDLEDYPAEEIADAEEHNRDLVAEREGLSEVAEQLSAKYYERVFALVQVLLSERDALDVRTRFNATERAFVLQGWMSESGKGDLVAALAESGSDVDVTFDDPGPEDKVPVELANKRFLKPFEVLTDLYGRPRYEDIDPTPLMALSFTLFFGICVGDVGYGLVLILGCLFTKYRLDVADGVKNFLNLIMIGSVASIAVGIVTRSYFALPPEALPAFLRYDPVLLLPDDMLIYLILSLALGVIHLLFGIGVGFYQHARKREWTDILSQVLPVPMILTALVTLVLVPDASTLSLVLLALAVLLQGRIAEVRSLGSALLVLPLGLLGVFNGFLGFFGDSLSYTRLAALGLASFLVGDVINRLAGISLGLGAAGIVFAIGLFLVGQGINVILALLGAFVHPTRLHLVEFFSKFYEAGGVRFAPFAVRAKSLVLHPEPGVGTKGGRSK